MIPACGASGPVTGEPGLELDPVVRTGTRLNSSRTVLQIQRYLPKLHRISRSRKSDWGHLNRFRCLVGYFGLTKDTTKVISITGCNAARGTACLDSVRNANVELIGKPVHPELPHLTRKWLTQDSRLVDTSKTAAELCMGSFAQQLHQELMTLGIRTTIYARLYVVVVEDDGQKRTMHYHYKPVWDPDGKNPHSSYHHGEKDRTKIKISATDGDQMFEYVQYDDNAKAQQRMSIRVAKAHAKARVNQKTSNRP